MNNPMYSTGWIAQVIDGQYNFVGSCFAYRSQNILITAGHCVADRPKGELLVFSGMMGINEGIPIDNVIIHDDMDIAILIVSGPPGCFDTFMEFSHSFQWGCEVTAFGYPEDSSKSGMRPTARYFRGHVQRVFMHEFRHPHNQNREAIELNFGAPGGLSGGPIALKDSSDTVIGIVVENHDSTTYLQTITDIHNGCEHTIEKVHSVISYGIGLALYEAIDWIDSVIAEYSA